MSAAAGVVEGGQPSRRTSPRRGRRERGGQRSQRNCQQGSARVRLTRRRSRPPATRHRRHAGRYPPKSAAIAHLGASLVTTMLQSSTTNAGSSGGVSLFRGGSNSPCSEGPGPPRERFAWLAHAVRVTFDRMTVDPDRRGGVACIRTPRFPVTSVVAMVADGMANEEILAEHPDLELADIAEALRYAALALQDRELPLRRPA